MATVRRNGASLQLLASLGGPVGGGGAPPPPPRERGGDSTNALLASLAGSMKDVQELLANTGARLTGLEKATATDGLAEVVAAAVRAALPAPRAGRRARGRAIGTAAVDGDKFNRTLVRHSGSTRATARLLKKEQPRPLPTGPDSRRRNTRALRRTGPQRREGDPPAQGLAPPHHGCRGGRYNVRGSH